MRNSLIKFSNIGLHVHSDPVGPTAFYDRRSHMQPDT